MFLRSEKLEGLILITKRKKSFPEITRLQFLRIPVLSSEQDKNSKTEKKLSDSHQKGKYY